MEIIMGDTCSLNFMHEFYVQRGKEYYTTKYLLVALVGA